ncbi:DNA (cytosine-5-)-methyltransferase [Alkanindiges hydrocarboniclasticus]|uniref:DNA (cytosine-5-)-methyltransferase n=1 Tax=Alkanindiges hydrocarboniclasticus TaxID=1907941 RepID=A0A1S8CZ21_9GAMM|nr:DNA cytosine methyltransferase [Alkanindiges hydrocarboniclasticus]ONG41854.1 DNA (cytosine-5-)-methyltransferase [Alkanindiges hydrocarboniclasticus]
MHINVIDLFAGPGGLGEGFFSFNPVGEKYFPFQALCSVEKDIYAHATLRLRAFYRKLVQSGQLLPDNYYRYARNLADLPHDEHSAKLWENACEETLLLTLGDDEAKDMHLFNVLKQKLICGSQVAPTVLIGGPPCQAYSLVGRARNKGNSAYVPEKDGRHFLYKEYLKIMEIFSPDIFIMENVKGLLTSQVNGGAVFNQILADLQTCSEGYTLFSLNTGEPFGEHGFTDPRDFVLASEKYGVPQARHRIIIMGVKKSTAALIERIRSLEEKPPVSVGDAISNLPARRSSFSNRSRFFSTNTFEDWKLNLNRGINNLLSTDKSLDTELVEAMKDYLLKINNSVEPRQQKEFYQYLDMSRKEYHDFVCDSQGEEVLSHEPRPHMDSDLIRYFFCAVFRRAKGRNPRDHDFPAMLAPEHKSWNSGKFMDRFKVQGEDGFSSTVTSHISKDGHYFIHPDPVQCRSLTVREAARLQSFPDSYLFMGPRTQQYHQVGNAVPPLLARQIASIVYDTLMSVNGGMK